MVWEKPISHKAQTELIISHFHTHHSAQISQFSSQFVFRFTVLQMVYNMQPMLWHYHGFLWVKGPHEMEQVCCTVCWQEMKHQGENRVKEGDFWAYRWAEGGIWTSFLTWKIRFASEITGKLRDGVSIVVFPCTLVRISRQFQTDCTWKLPEMVVHISSQKKTNPESAGIAMSPQYIHTVGIFTSASMHQ